LGAFPDAGPKKVNSTDFRQQKKYSTKLGLNYSGLSSQASRFTNMSPALSNSMSV